MTGATGPSGGTAISHGVTQSNPATYRVDPGHVNQVATIASPNQPPSHFAPPPLSISLDPVTGLALVCLFVGVVIAPKLQIAHLRLIQ